MAVAAMGVAIAAISVAVLAFAPGALAAFPGHDGKLVYEITSSDDEGMAFGDFPTADGKLALLSPGARPQALLSCSETTGGGCSAAGRQDGLGCSAAPQGPCLDDSRPSFSPDGTRIVFTDDPCAVRYCRRITLINADGSGETRLPALTADDATPAFTESGALVFTGRATRESPQNLYTVSVDGTGLRQLTQNGASQPAPCTNGSIAFVHDHNLYVRGVRGRSRLLARGASWPDCSPNSRQIAFLHKKDLYLVGANGKGLRRLTTHQIAAAAPGFSPDGRLIALGTDHKASKAWPPKGSGIDTNVYLQIIDLHGRERRKPVFLASNGSDQDGFGFGADVGGVSWQP